MSLHCQWSSTSLKSSSLADRCCPQPQIRKSLQPPSVPVILSSVLESTTMQSGVCYLCFRSKRIKLQLTFTPTCKCYNTEAYVELLKKKSGRWADFNKETSPTDSCPSAGSFHSVFPKHVTNRKVKCRFVGALEHWVLLAWFIYCLRTYTMQCMVCLRKLQCSVSSSRWGWQSKFDLILFYIEGRERRKSLQNKSHTA